MASMETVLAALQTLYTDPKPEAKQQANAWLENFQKEVRDFAGDSIAQRLTSSCSNVYSIPQSLQPEAWETANVILSSPEAPPEPKLFAAQTFRAKVSRYFIDVKPGQQDMQPPQGTEEWVISASWSYKLADLEWLAAHSLYADTV